MNTKTMRLPPRRVLTPDKRKEREGPDTLKPSIPTKLAKLVTSQAGSEKSPETYSSNQLLAGYLAHEFLTDGTLFGQPFDPARAEASPLSGVESRKAKPTQKAEAESHQRYVEVSRLLKIGGAHVPGVVNPTQLAGFLRL